MNLDLNYDEAIDFIIHLDELNLKHDDSEALKRKARGILINFVNSLNLVDSNQAYITDANGFYTAKKNDDGSYSIIDSNGCHNYEDVTYRSDVIRAFLDDKSLHQRLQEEKEAEIAALKNGTSATSGQNNNLPAVAKPARPFVLNLIKTGYPNGEFKNWKREAIANEVFDRAKAARYEEKDIPAVSTIMRHYFK